MTGVDIGAVAPQLGEARVVNQDNYNIWGILTGVRPRGEMGFGGDCLPKDTLALVTELEQRGLDYDLLRAVLSDNLRLKGEN